MNSPKVRTAENKLASYLGFNFTIWQLLELWEQLDRNILSADELGIADHLVYTYGPDEIHRILSKDLIPKLTSEDLYEQREALLLMEEMGFEL